MKKTLTRLPALALLCLLWAIPTMAQTVPDYDPSYIPSQFRVMQYAKCGIRAAADPSWPRTQRRYLDANGSKVDEYAYKLGTEFWKKDKRLGSRFSANPNLTIHITCNDSKLRQKFFDGMVREIYAGSKKTRGESWGKLMRFDVPGIGPVSYYVGSRKGGGAQDVARTFFQHRGRIVRIMIQIGRSGGKDVSGRRLNAGKIVELADNDGNVYRFRVTRKATQNPLGAVGYLRTKAENRAFIETILKSLKPM